MTWLRLRVLLRQMVLYAVAIAACAYAIRNIDASHNLAVLGLVSQFSGTATAIFVALQTSPLTRSGMIDERIVTIRTAQLTATLLAIATFMSSTLATQYLVLGPTALATCALLCGAIIMTVLRPEPTSTSKD